MSDNPDQNMKNADHRWIYTLRYKTCKKADKTWQFHETCIITIKRSAISESYVNE